jgi:hypothetical protein
MDNDVPTSNTLHARLANTSASFLVDNSPITSSHALEPLLIQCLPPIPPIPSELGNPSTPLEGYLVNQCKDFEQQESALVRGYHGAYVQSVLADCHCQLLQGQLGAKEKVAEAWRAGKGKGKLLGDGLPCLLTNNDFYRHIVDAAQAEAEEAEVQQRRRDEAAENKRMRDEWLVGEVMQKEANRKVHQEWKAGPLAVWEAERALAKTENRHPGWKQLNAPPKLWAVPKLWQVAPVITIGEPGPSQHADAIEDDDDSHGNATDASE